MRVRVGFLAFEAMDLMDYVGPYEVLHTANRLRQRAGADGPFEVMTIGPKVTGFGGLGVVPQYSVDEIDRLDVLIVPGAIDVEGASPDRDLVALAERTETLASVCTGAFFLARNDLLGDGPATTHWEDVGDLDGVETVSDRRWVDNGEVITAGGISSGIAMALHLVDRFADRTLAEATARQIDYVWTESR